MTDVTGAGGRPEARLDRAEVSAHRPTVTAWTHLGANAPTCSTRCASTVHCSSAPSPGCPTSRPASRPRPASCASGAGQARVGHGGGVGALRGRRPTAPARRRLGEHRLERPAAGRARPAGRVPTARARDPGRRRRPLRAHGARHRRAGRLRRPRRAAAPACGPWFEAGASWSARRVFLHLVAEISQHAGHADVLRESIDGRRSMG